MVSGSQASMPLLFLKDVPKQSSKLRLDFSSLLGPVFYMWIINLLFPVRKSSSRISVKFSNFFSILCSSLQFQVKSATHILQVLFHDLKLCIFVCR
jgi:hypothetical protein